MAENSCESSIVSENVVDFFAQFDGNIDDLVKKNEHKVLSNHK